MALSLALEGREEEIQELLDAGYSYNKMAQITGISDKSVKKFVVQKGLEFYKPFDEEQDERQLVMNFEWLYEEDALDEICRKVFNGEEAVLTKDLGIFVREKYGDIFSYLNRYSASVLAYGIKKICSDCEKLMPITDYNKHVHSPFGLSYTCKNCECNRNSKNARINGLRRRARKQLLPDTFTSEQMEEVMKRFGGCALTGDVNDLDWDHAIPISIGRGGTTYENMYPLKSSLNRSKNDSNIFEWFKTNRQRFKLSQKRFDILIEWLADVNEITIDEYRDYVYWCHENPISINEIEATS